jgi:hypothetical protein
MSTPEPHDLESETAAERRALTSGHESATDLLRRVATETGRAYSPKIEAEVAATIAVAIAEIEAGHCPLSTIRRARSILLKRTNQAFAGINCKRLDQAEKIITANQPRKEN